MKNIFLLLLLSLLQVVTPGRAAVIVGGGGAGGVPGSIVNVAPGATLSRILSNAIAGTTYQLGAGTYTVTPSVLNSNLTSGNQFQGITFANKTNVTILGVPGLSIIDGSSSLGELLWITNCARIVIEGVTFKGYTNHNIQQLPTYGGVGGLWASVNLYQSEHITFMNCRWLGSAGHGLQDKGAEAASFVASTSISTNQIIVEDCYFEDIGGWRNIGAAIYEDGTAIVPTGWTIRRNKFVNCLRGVEPYNENDPGIVFNNCLIEGNSFLNMVTFGVSPVGSTNGHNVIVRGNTIEFQPGAQYHGSNANPFQVGIEWNSGQAWKILNNSITGGAGRGILAGNASTQIGDGLISGNLLIGQTNTGAGVSYGLQTVTLYRTQITGNYFTRSKTYGMYLLGLRDSEVSGNQFINPVFGNTALRLASFAPDITSNVTIRANYFHDFVPGRLVTAIDDQLGGLLKVRLIENVIQGATVGVSVHALTLGDNLFISGPPSVFNFTNNFPALAAGGSFLTNFTAIGTRTNDSVKLMIPNQFFGLSTNVISTAWGSNDSVFIYLHNAGPAASAASSYRMKAVVTQVEAY